MKTHLTKKDFARWMNCPTAAYHGMPSKTEGGRIEGGIEELLHEWAGV